MFAVNIHCFLKYASFLFSGKSDCKGETDAGAAAFIMDASDLTTKNTKGYTKVTKKRLVIRFVIKSYGFCIKAIVCCPER
jgi:hypothetical protein